MGFRSRQNSIFLTAAMFVTSTLGSAMGDPGAATPTAPKKIFYADPVKGSTAKGNGSRSKPWGSLQSIVEAKFIDGSDKTNGKIHAGDLVYLMTGDHGTISMWGTVYTNTDFITLQAAPGQTPVINALTLSNCSKWVVRGVVFENPPVVTQRQALINVQKSSDIIIDSNRLRSKLDVRQWTPKDWEESSATHAIFTNDCASVTISKNMINNVQNGIAVTGDSMLVVNNVIDYFANDGIQFTANNSEISRNRITNHYGLWNDGYHHDGMQGYTAWNETATRNVVLDSNVVLASTNTYPDIPAIPSGEGDDYMQGIVIFQGDWDNLTVTNNVVAAASGQGMTFTNVKNSKIVNNTLIAQSPKYDSWLGIFGDSENVIVRNNIAHSFAMPETGVVFDSNLSLTKSWQPWQKGLPYTNPVNVFAKWSPKTAEFDFRLAAKSYAIGRGSVKTFAARDIMYVNRVPQKVDMGAYVKSLK